jgi:hypothetical protein
VIKIIQNFVDYPPRTSRLCRQLKFLKLCFNLNVEEYLIERDKKYENQLQYAENKLKKMKLIEKNDFYSKEISIFRRAPPFKNKTNELMIDHPVYFPA